LFKIKSFFTLDGPVTKGNDTKGCPYRSGKGTARRQPNMQEFFGGSSHGRNVKGKDQKMEREEHWIFRENESLQAATRSGLKDEEIGWIPNLIRY